MDVYMEFRDTYDINRQKTEKTMVRGETIDEGDYHLLVHVCIFNSKKEMLNQQRQHFKDASQICWILQLVEVRLLAIHRKLCRKRNI